MRRFQHFDVGFHVSLLTFLLYGQSLGITDPSLIFSLNPINTVSDLCIWSLIKYFLYSNSAYHFIACILPLFKILARILDIYAEFFFSDFIFACIASCLVSCIGFYIKRNNGVIETDPDAIPLSFTRLFRFANGHWTRLFVGLGVLLIRLPFSMASPHWVSEAIGALLAQDYERLKYACIALFTCGCLDSILDFWCVYIFATVQQEVIHSLRCNLFRSITHHKLEFFDTNPVGELQSRLSADTAEVANDLSWVFRFAIEAIVRVVGIVIYMFWCSWRLALLVVAIVPINGVINTYFGQWMARNSKQCQAQLATSNCVANETFGSMQTVKSFSGEAKAFQTYVKALVEYKNLQYQSSIVSAVYYMFASTFLMHTLMQTLIVAYGGLLALNGFMPTERLLPFLLFRNQLQSWFSSILDTYVNLVKCAGLSDRIFQLLSCEQNDMDEGNPVSETLPTEDAVAFDEVSLTYPSRSEICVLSNVSFRAKIGQCTAIVGPSGSGKSSIISLLLRLYRPTNGKIFLNGRNICIIPLSLVRGKFLSVVSQEPVLFRGSLRDNILYSLSLDQIRNLPNSVIDRMVDIACKTACIDSFINDLPNGLDTVIGDRGVTLSGGQKQRIAIARAVLTNPSILLLDEAMSALDPDSEAAVQAALYSAMESRTTIMVSHRISSVVDIAERVIVMDKGVVVEQGTPKDLLIKEPTSQVSLRTLYDMQKKHV